MNDNVGDTTVHHVLAKTTYNGLDLGQFGHGSVLALGVIRRCFRIEAKGKVSRVDALANSTWRVGRQFKKTAELVG